MTYPTRRKHFLTLSAVNYILATTTEPLFIFKLSLLNFRMNMPCDH